MPKSRYYGITLTQICLFSYLFFHFTLFSHTTTYGKYWLRLHNNKELLDRVTLTPDDSLDSYTRWNQKSIGTFKHMNHILFLTDKELFRDMVTQFIDPSYNPYHEAYYPQLEFQIHGDVTFKDNVAQIHHPKNTKRESQKFCKKYNCESVEYGKNDTRNTNNTNTNTRNRTKNVRNRTKNKPLSLLIY